MATPPSIMASEVADMKTAVTKTSLDSYDALKADGLTNMQTAIVSRMKPGVKYSRRMLSVLTGMETSSVAGRTNELLARSVIEVSGTMQCPFTLRTVEAVRLVEKQLDLTA